ncbi:MAG: Gfo/Idh/MocA family oxidoreductase [Bacteriovoracaceae bacterium]|jgi:predicted dehydrogenase|nr:hypothetical protein [Halobacteriovoraceae bacterium]MDP7320216.1 Gfo/Idh/MocA family oxidoreductase [Bacteriovoracaceae bacterium]
MNKVKVAVIGYGHLGKWHAQKADALENSELVAIVEPMEANRSAAKEAYSSVEVVADVKEIMDRIDAAVVVTPTSFHYEMVKDLLKNDKHVFCEKPLCSTYEEAIDLKSFLGKSILQVGHSERCHEAWDKLARVFREQKTPRTIKITRQAAFKGRATDVDVVQDLMIHDIDLMLYLFGKKPIAVETIGHKIRTNKWDHVTAHFFLEGGDQVIITSGRNYVHEVRSLEVMSEQGCYYVDLFENSISYATDSKFDDGSFVKKDSYQKRDHLLIEQEKFYDAILDQKEPMVTYQDGVNAVLYVSKVLESLDENKRLTL